MESRYIVSDPANLLSSGDTDAYLAAALEDIVGNYPPRSRYPHEILQGLWSGPTGMGYLLLQVASHRPDLVISGQPAMHWARAYMAGSRGHNLRLGSHGCGIGDEKLAFEAVRAAVSKDPQHVRDFVSSVSQILAVDEYPDETLFGRAGALYMLRLVRHWVPGSNARVDPAVAEISNTILNNGPNWKWRGKRYLGAVHGDVGIFTQLVLTSPSLAPRIEPLLRRLLDMQMADGNWPSSEGQTHGGKGLVQFCHGAPGVISSLLSLREHFPQLHDNIDRAVSRGRECVWSQGLLKKEPNLCHGIFGNALTLPPGHQREHFLGIAAPENVSDMKKSDPTGTVFERADYGRSYSALTSYTPSAVWTWLVCREEEPRVLAYNDI
ncbi:hypothetical protein B0T16DRAFT_337478 [Cercophora newfieldiana]|uniref:Uncharacterized protein n=1 Tax=Cercophora newfieldiana TaxID=92897 RepID=A0AA40CID8_9PEZI|nr:hypothetical protein B0T16DRAFT_337478 [Cercophora newfieldiana]